MSFESKVGEKIGRYILIKFISSGSYGAVYKVQDSKTKEFKALKMPIVNKNHEKGHTESSYVYSETLLLDEARIYKNLTDNQTFTVGIASVKISEHNNKKYIIMDLLGESIQDIFDKIKKFSLQTIIKISIQFFEILKFIHSRGYIHRDLKPSNFVIGTKDHKDIIYCIDFGLATKYIDKENNHIRLKDYGKFCGTLRFSSIASQRRFTQSRKDDLESIMYTISYLYNGKLPWSNIKIKDKKLNSRTILQKKINSTTEEICGNLPNEFHIIYNYITSMPFDEKPPYNSFIKTFKNILKKYDDISYEWI